VRRGLDLVRGFVGEVAGAFASLHYLSNHANLVQETELRRLQDLRVDHLAYINAKRTTLEHPPSILVFTSPLPSRPLPLRDQITPDQLKKAKRTSAPSSKI
jgi:hypothetical protein